MLPRRIQRVSIWGSWAIAFFLFGMVLVNTLRSQGTDVERRISGLETIRAAERLSVIESRLESIEFWGRSIFVAVIGQAIIGGLNLTRRRQS